jgi:hypothetical protein
MCVLFHSDVEPSECAWNRCCRRNNHDKYERKKCRFHSSFICDLESSQSMIVTIIQCVQCRIMSRMSKYKYLQIWFAVK